MSTLPSNNNNFNNNIHISSTALDAHLTNLRSSIPPSIATCCFPDSLSSFLRNLLLLMGIPLNIFLVLGTLFSVGVRYVGLSILFVACISFGHVVSVCLALGCHLVDSVSRLSSSLGSSGGRFTNTLRAASSRYGSDIYIHGILLGSTIMMGLLMHVVSSYYDGLSNCVASTTANANSNAASATNLTGGYANMHTSNGHHTTSASSIDPYATCGASGPVGFVSFISWWLVWFNVILGMTLFTKRDEILSGVGGGGSGQYDEIDGGSGGFDGDFPSSSGGGGMRTMHV